MLEGITILNQTEIMKMSDAGLIWTLILIIGGIICVFVSVVLLNIHDAWAIGVIIGLILFMTGIFVGIATDESEPTGRYRYEVLIDKSVSFEDVCENYDVVKQKGKIWILEDKEKMSE